MEWRYTDGYFPDEFSNAATYSDDASLTEKQKNLFFSFSCSAASKTLTLGLKDGQSMILTNVGGTNAVTVKNVAGDTGTSLGAGKVALVIASTTANATVVKVLN